MKKDSLSYIDIYDFDHTIYDGDSSLDFYFFSVRQKPSILKYLPSQLFHTGLFALSLEPRTSFKANFFKFLKAINDIESHVERFWDVHYKNIKPWYRDSDHSHDVIISASPDFLLEVIQKRLKVHSLIATKTSAATGIIEGKNCRGQEKVIRLNQIFEGPTVRKVYSDSMSDKPILSLAEEPYVVLGDKAIRYDEYKKMSSAKRFVLGLHVLKFW